MTTSRLNHAWASFKSTVAWVERTEEREFVPGMLSHEVGHTLAAAVRRAGGSSHLTDEFFVEHKTAIEEWHSERSEGLFGSRKR